MCQHFGAQTYLYTHILRDDLLMQCIYMLTRIEFFFSFAFFSFNILTVDIQPIYLYFKMAKELYDLVTF